MKHGFMDIELMGLTFEVSYYVLEGRKGCGPGNWNGPEPDYEDEIGIESITVKGETPDLDGIYYRKGEGKYVPIEEEICERVFEARR